MYTNGVIEAANDRKEQYGEERLHAFVTEKARLSGEDFADDLLNAVTDWGGGEEKIDDDIALIVVDVE